MLKMFDGKKNIEKCCQPMFLIDTLKHVCKHFDFHCVKILAVIQESQNFPDEVK